MGSQAGAQPAGQDEVFERVSAVVLAVTSQLSVRDVLQMIVRSARSLAGARYAALGVPDDHGGFAEFVVDGVSARQQAEIGPLPRQHGMLAVILRDGKPLRLADIKADPRFGGWWPDAHPDLTDVIGVPILDAGPEGSSNDRQVLGFIFAAAKRAAGGFSERDERVLTLFAAHAAIALTNARLYERGRELSVLEERARLARDLHDAVAQKLFSVRAKAHGRGAAGGRAIRTGRWPRSTAWRSWPDQAHAELRAVIDGLAPPDLAAGGLVASIRSYAVLIGRTHGARVKVDAGDLPELDSGAETVLYRVAQEAISNALRHSGSPQVRVDACGPGRAAFSSRWPMRAAASTWPSPAGGLGLESMRERAAAVGGPAGHRVRPGRGHHGPADGAAAAAGRPAAPIGRDAGQS